MTFKETNKKVMVMTFSVIKTRKQTTLVTIGKDLEEKQEN